MANYTTTGSDTFPAGHVLQTVRGTHNTETNTNSTSYAATGLYASITPATTGNKVLVQVNSSILNSMSGTVSYLTVYANHADGSTMVNIDGTGSANSVGYSNLHDANTTTTLDILVPATVTELHSPGTSGTAIRYELYVRSSTSSQNVHWSQNAARSTIILQEIRA
jgi:hypothetical protein